MDLAGKSNREIDQWISNHESKGMTAAPLYMNLLEERVRRSQEGHKLDFERSLAHLKVAAVEQRCTTYGALAEASGVEWSKARHQMNGQNGHLDRLLDVCHSRNLPKLTAICVNLGSVAEGELSLDALTGFAEAGRRLGIAISDPVAFHHECREACWAWGRQQSENDPSSK